MGKKIKLSLDDIKITSFVTSLNDNQKEEVKAGGTYTVCKYYSCLTYCPDCWWSDGLGCDPTNAPWSCECESTDEWCV